MSSSFEIQMCSIKALTLQTNIVFDHGTLQQKVTVVPIITRKVLNSNLLIYQVSNVI